MMRFRMIMLVTLAVVITRLPGATASVVPADAVIDDRTATLALAEALFEHPSTRGEALAACAAWLASNPGDQEFIIRMARYETWTGLAREAALRLESLAAATSLSSEARDVLIDAYLQAGRFADAMRESNLRLAGITEPSAALLVIAGDTRFRAGQPAAAVPFYRRAVAIDGANVRARRSLALSLAYSGQARDALALLEELARSHPDDSEVMRALVNLSRNPESAARLVELIRERAEREPDNPEPLIEWAELSAASGHAVTARGLFRRALALATSAAAGDYALRFTRARLGWGDFYGAEAEFRKSHSAHPDDAALRTDLINLLIAMDRLEEAEAETGKWLAAAPTAAAAIAARAEIVRKRRFMSETEVASPVESDADPVSAAFRRAGVETVRSAEFVNALTAGADTYQAEGKPLPIGVTIPESAARLHRWAGMYASQGDFSLAVRCLRAARLADPDYFPAWIDLAEFLAIEGNHAEASREFTTLVATFPESRQVLLKQARALGWGRRYQESLDAYAALRALNPADPVPLLEQARVAGWAKRRAEAAGLYSTIWSGPVDDRLAEGLRPILAKEPDPAPAVVAAWRSWAASAAPASGEAPFAATERLQTEAEALGSALSAVSQAALTQLRIDLRADFLLQRAFWLENRAKQEAWDRRWWRAAETYERLLAVAPGNQEALFDLAQVRAAQGLGQRERDSLRRLLELDANNRLAGTALFRRDRRSDPLLMVQFEHYREKGRDDLSSIRRFSSSLGGEIVRKDQFRFSAAWRTWRDEPDTAPVVSRASGLSIGADGSFSDRLTASVSYTHKDADSHGANIADTGGAQGWLHFRQGHRFGAGFEVREELANAFALSRGIRSTHRWLGGIAVVTRRLEIEARTAAIEYSDDNSGSHLWVAPAYSWTDHPRTFKTILTLEARDTHHANLYQYAGPTLTDIVHPYWTPQTYRGTTLTLEWRHDLARDFFIGAQEHWYDVRVSFSDSNDGNQGFAWSADYAREWLDRWVLRLGVNQTRSQQWDDLRALARFARRF